MWPQALRMWGEGKETPNGQKKELTTQHKWDVKDQPTHRKNKIRCLWGKGDVPKCK